MKIGIIVQARMGSTRLSGKVLKEIKGSTMLEHVVKRLQQSNYADSIIIATTNSPSDAKIEEEAKRLNTTVFRGSEDNVLSRYYYAAKENELDIVIRVTSDCPLIDPLVLDEMIHTYLDNECDVLTNVGMEAEERTFPRGLDAEMFSFAVLEEAFKSATEKYQKEHVTPYIYEHSENTFYYNHAIDYSKHRWTVDTQEDFELITAIYNYLYEGTHDFYLNDIVKLFAIHPELYAINAEIEQKKIKDVD